MAIRLKVPLFSFHATRQVETVYLASLPLHFGPSNRSSMAVCSGALVLGIDLGTSSVKTLLLRTDSDDVRVINSCCKETHAQTPCGSCPEGSEQDVRKIVEALNECLASFPNKLLQLVTRIGISGQMHGVVFWKIKQGCQWSETEKGWAFQPDFVSSLVTWQDGRCSKDFLSSLPQPQTHLSVATGFGCATIYWYLKNRPDFLEQYDVAGTIQDYVVAMLCDLKRPLMSIQNAASWGYFNTVTKSWNHDILRDSGFPVSLLPDIGEPGGVAGRTSYQWAGIPKGTEVGIALGDFQCSVYSSMSETTDAVLNVSTSAQLTYSLHSGFKPADRPDPGAAVAYFPYFHNHYLAVAASLNGGNVLAEFVRMLIQWTADLGHEVTDTTVYARIINAALACNDAKLTVKPTIFGERHMPDLLASVSNICLSELSLGHVTRSLCRGIVQNLHSMLPYEVLKEAGIMRIMGSGSALSKNEVLRQEVEKVFPLPVVYGKDVDSALGAALVMMHRRREAH
ncbi:sedoheptulokinase isoform X2 [Ambystoma mexicanum]|uniref:sedoheptulokinase isoform X2 n=1 Tax=Ambystoma mexicanum TaxID=8296 RepID=UPI0037E7D707